MKLRRFPDPRGWYEAVREHFLSCARETRAKGEGFADICLAGGSTPLSVYASLASDPDVALAFSGTRIRLWPGDERAVPSQDPRSNGFSIEVAFRNCIWNPLPDIILWPLTENPAEDQAALADQAASAYAKILDDTLGPAPSFDLLVLGLGGDGHTAGLFPGDPVLGERKRFACPSRSPISPFQRMSLTYPVLEASHHRIFLVRGPGKEEVLGRLESGDSGIPAFPLADGAEILHCEAP